MEEMQKKGFTLTELLVVIAVIAVITLITVPSIWLINRNSSTRIFNSRKEFALSAGQFYGQDNDNIFTDSTYDCGLEIEGRDFACVKVNELIEKGYLDPDTKVGEKGCEYAKGCMTNPVDNTILNDTDILLRKENDSIIAKWDGDVAITDDDVLVNIVCERLGNGTYTGKFGTGPNDTCDCDDFSNGGSLATTGSACLISGDVTNNYLSYSGYMWRLMGVYKVNNDLVVKMVTDDNLYDQ